MTFTPTLRVEAGFGYQPMDDPIVWTDLASFKPRNLSISRGRPSELGRYRSASVTLQLVDTTSRHLDPGNLSGPYVTTVSEEEFPSLATVTKEVGTSLGTNNSISLPSGVLTGDLLLAFVSVDNPGATDTVTGSGSATWATLSNTLFTGNVIRQTVFARIANGSDALVLTGASQDYTVQIMRVVRHNCSTTSDVKIATAATGTSTTANSPSLATGATKKYLWVSAITMDATIATTYLGIPNGFTFYDFASSDSTSASAVAGMLATRYYEGATLDPGAWSNESQEWIGQTLAIPGLATTYDESQIGPNLPIRVVAELPSRETVLDDPCAGPGLHSAWRVTNGSITSAISGTLPFGSTGNSVTMYGPVFNFDSDSSFMFGITDEGSTPNINTRIEFAAGGSMGFTIDTPAGTVLTWFVDDGDGGGLASGNTPWSDANHRYLRIRIDGNDVVFERSADNSSWTALGTFTRGTDFGSHADWSAGRIRLLSTGGAVTFGEFLVQVSQFTRFVGSVDQWNYLPLPGNEGAIVELSATDAFKVFGNTQLDSVFAALIRESAPDAWYRLGEKSGGSVFDSSGNGHHGNYPALSVASKGGGAPTRYLGSGGVKLTGKSLTPGVRLAGGARRTSLPYTINAWFQTDGLLPNAGLATLLNRSLGCIYTQGSAAGPTGVYDGWQVAFGISSNYFTGIDNTVADNPVITEWLIGLFTAEPGTTATDIQESWFRYQNDGLPHMITVVCTAVGTYEVYLDGELAPLFFNRVDSIYAFQGHHVGRGDAPNYYEAGYSLPGVVDELSLYSRALSNSEIRELVQAGKQPWINDSAGERIHKILDQIGWPEHLRSIDLGTVVLEPAEIEGDSVLSHFQSVEATEAGRLYVGANGEVVFHDSKRVAERTSTVMVFDDAGAGVNILGDGFRISQDDRSLFTQAQIGTVSGQLQTYQDDAAVAKYGARAISISSLLCASDLFAYMRAVQLVDRYKRQQIKIEAFSVAPEKDPSVWPNMLELRLGDTINVTFTLLGTGDAYDENLILDVINEQVADGAWVFSLQGSGEDPDYGRYFEWDASADVGWDSGKWL